MVLIADGEILRRNPHRERITVDEFAARAGVQQIAWRSDVRWAILETSGQISVMPR